MISWGNIFGRGHARVVYHRLWRGSVSYRNKDWDLWQLWNFWVGILVRISWMVTECLSRHCIIGLQTDFG